MNGKTAKLVRKFTSLLRSNPDKAPVGLNVKKMLMHGSHRDKGRVRAAVRRMLAKAGG
jgi:hypothetical protein